MGQKINVQAQSALDTLIRTEGTPFGIGGAATPASVSVGGNIQILQLNSESTGSFPVRTGFMPIIKSIRVMSSVDIDISVRQDNSATSIFKGVNDKVSPNGYTRVNQPISLKAGQYFEITPDIQQLGYRSNISFVSLSAIATPFTFTYNINGYSLSANRDLETDYVYMSMGDSITFGTGAGAFENNEEQPYTQTVKRWVYNRGYRARLCNKAQSSMTSDSIVRAIDWGYYDIQNVKLVTLMIGANDSNNLGLTGNMSSTANQDLFRNNMVYILNYLTKVHSSAKILVLGSTPSSDNTVEGLIAITRNILSSVVGEYGDKVSYHSLATAFDRTNPANYLPSDTIHPKAQNAIASSITAKLTELNWMP